MRSKEEAHDYRYFPEPDLPPLLLDSARVSAIRAQLPERPEARRRRFVEQYAIPEYDAGQLTQSRDLAEYFEAAVAAGAPAKLASNWIMGELARKLKEANLQILHAPVPPGRLAGLTALIEKGTLSGPMAKEVFEKMFASGESAEAIVSAQGLAQIDDEAAILALVDSVVQSQTDAVAQYRAGKTAAFGFLVGQIMKSAGGKANPKKVTDALRRRLGG
jgi:aspartyl-tRNA(Asn)/glutamyl-tRNA(Gln) amidotransferase subunit B